MLGFHGVRGAADDYPGSRSQTTRGDASPQPVSQTPDNVSLLRLNEADESLLQMTVISRRTLVRKIGRVV